MRMAKTTEHWTKWLVMWAAGCLAVMGASPEGVPRDAVIPLDPAVKQGRLENGLTYYIRKNQKPENRAELRLVVNAGSMQEKEDQRGLAHFVEHMAFNGTEHFEKQELVNYLESIGIRFGPDINAFTSFDETVYMLQVPTDDREIMEKAFLILEDWAGGVSFEAEEIEKERGVVLEEWRLGRGAMARIRDKQFPILFKGSRYAERMVIGEPEILRNASRETIVEYYENWYRPDLMAVIAVGDFEIERIEELIRNHFGGLTNPDSAPERRIYPVPDHQETLFAIATDPEATQSSIGIYTKREKQPHGTVSDLRRQLVEGMYHGMLNERLSELRQKPNPPFLYGVSQAGGFVRSKDVLVQVAGVEEGKVMGGLEALLRETERVDRHGFTMTELDRMKTNILRGLEQSYRERDKQQSASFTWEYMSHYLRNEPAPGIEYQFELVQQLLPTISLEEVNRAADEYITDGNRVVMFSGPEKEGSTPPSEEALMALLEASEEAEIPPYEDKLRDEPLVSQMPEAGQVVEEKEIEELDVVEWRLSNGIRVVLKPTDFKNDEVQLTGFSPGGHSLVSDSEHSSALYATSVLSAGGLGEFDRIELGKALAGKVAQAWSYIAELEEGISGSASPEDMETMFQLVYLHFTEPRMDPEAVEAWRDRMEAGLENRLSRPETVFGDKWSTTLSQGHHRRRPPSKEKLDEVELEAAYEIHRARFRDASDFTFILVGNFTLEEIKPLVLNYLGGLPASGREETWKDVGVARPRGVTKFEVRRGLEPKSQVRMLFHGDADWSRQEDHLIGALASVLRIRLREVLREDLGGTYGVGVGANISRRPEEEYSFSISFGAAPDNVERLIEAVFAEIESIQKEGIDDSYLQKVKETQLRRHEVDLKENGYWLRALEGHYTFGTDPRLILQYESLVNSVTVDRLQQAAQRYLDREQYVLGVLFPEKEAGSEESNTVN